MTMPRFFSRVADAIGPVAHLDTTELAAHLDTVTVAINLDGDEDLDVAHRGAALLAVNLAARLYPHLHLSGQSSWKTEASALARAINPSVSLDEQGPRRTVVLRIAGATLEPSAPPAGVTAQPADTITVAASGWNAHVDPDSSTDLGCGAHPLAAAAAACLGMAEVFRVVFCDALTDRGRRGPQPGSLSIVTCGDAEDLPLPTGTLELPPVTLIGAGAVGQACLWALTHTDVSMALTIVDPQTVALSNLQRYVLTTDTDVDAYKTDLAIRAADGSGITVLPVPTEWGKDDRSGPGAAIVLTALDSAADRIDVAAGLAEQVYNAWTQPADTGWSRHENFGTEPCLACLYYPDRPRPSEHELIAAALTQHPLRVLTYLVSSVPVGLALPIISAVPDLPIPPEASLWRQRPLLADLIQAGFIQPEHADSWANKTIGQLYRDGVCAGGLLRLPDEAAPEEALVPLAHQSALAGIMMAADLLIAHEPALRPVRRPTIEGRFNVLAGFPQVIGRPRQRTARCLCSDPFYVSATA